MTNNVNVEAIVERLLSYLKEAPIEAGSRKELVTKISHLGDTFAPNQAKKLRLADPKEPGPQL